MVKGKARQKNLLTMETKYCLHRRDTLHTRHTLDYVNPYSKISSKMTVKITSKTYFKNNNKNNNQTKSKRETNTICLKIFS